MGRLRNSRSTSSLDAASTMNTETPFPERQAAGQDFVLGFQPHQDLKERQDQVFQDFQGLFRGGEPGALRSGYQVFHGVVSLAIILRL